MEDIFEIFIMLRSASGLIPTDEIMGENVYFLVEMKCSFYKGSDSLSRLILFILHLKS